VNGVAKTGSRKQDGKVKAGWTKSEQGILFGFLGGPLGGDLNSNREFYELPGGPSAKPKCKGILTPGTRVICARNGQKVRKE